MRVSSWERKFIWRKHNDIAMAPMWLGVWGLGSHLEPISMGKKKIIQGKVGEKFLRLLCSRKILKKRNGYLLKLKC